MIEIPSILSVIDGDAFWYCSSTVKISFEKYLKLESKEESKPYQLFKKFMLSKSGIVLFWFQLSFFLYILDSSINILNNNLRIFSMTINILYFWFSRVVGGEKSVYSWFIINQSFSLKSILIIMEFKVLSYKSV